MASKLSVYVGAYFRIVVNKRSFETNLRTCPNGHSPSYAPFCAACGHPMQPQMEERYPETIYDLGLPLLGADDELCEITPPDLRGEGEIFACGNYTARDGCVWTWYSGLVSRSREFRAAALPSYEDTARMAAALMSDYAAVYQALLASPAVSSVRVAVGIVPYLD